MNLPVELYTPLFVLSRVAGWSAHIIEQLDNNRLIRPAPATRPNAGPETHRQPLNSPAVSAGRAST